MSHTHTESQYGYSATIYVCPSHTLCVSPTHTPNRNNKLNLLYSNIIHVTRIYQGYACLYCACVSHTKTY